MIIFFTNIKRILRDKQNLFFMLVIPMVFITVTMAAGSSRDVLKVGFIDNNRTEFTQLLKDSLEDSIKVIEINGEDIQDALISSKVDYVLAVDEGFTEKLINNEEVKLKGYSIKETNTSMPVRIYTEVFLNAAKNIALASEGSSEKFYQGLEYYRNGSFAAEYNSIGDGRKKKSSTLTSFGFLVMSMLFFATSAAVLALEDKRKNMVYRMFAAPVTSKQYMMQNILSYLVVLLIQVAAIMTIMLLVFKADLGPSIMNMFILLSVFAVVSISLGVAVSGISKDIRQASTIMNLITMPACMLGGCFWPRSIMPDILQRIGNFVPTTWALKGAEGILYGKSLAGVSKEIIVMLLFSLAFFLLGTWRKVDVSK